VTSAALDHARLGQLDHEPARVDAVASERFGEVVDEPLVRELGGCEVEPDSQPLGPAASRLERLVEDEPAELDRQSRLLCGGQELGCAEEAAGGVRPPRQHLEPLDLPVCEPHHGLEVDDDLTALERGLEVESELPLGAKLLVQVGLVQRVRTLRPLDAVHGDVGVADEVLAGGHARSSDGDADADVAGDIAAPERVCPVELLEHAPRRGNGSVCVRLADEHGELVAADPGGEILVTDGRLEATREFGEELVPRAVSPRVVDRLEAVEVEIEHCRRTQTTLELLLYRFEQVEAVGQTGECVVICLVAQLLLELRHLGERMLETAVLEQDARMAGEGLEQLDVGVDERADVAEALTDHQQSERPILAA
jgi:hypothetical protein